MRLPCKIVQNMRVGIAMRAYQAPSPKIEYDVCNKWKGTRPGDRCEVANGYATCINVEDSFAGDASTEPRWLEDVDGKGRVDPPSTRKWRGETFRATNLVGIPTKKRTVFSVLSSD